MSTEQHGEEWGRILESLDGKIMSNAPSCQRLSLLSGSGWRLNNVDLQLEPVQPAQIKCLMGYEVTAYSSITIYWRSNIEWSHSLWYCETEPEVSKWHEVAFSRKPLPLPDVYFAKRPEDPWSNGEEEDDLVVHNAINLAEFSERWVDWFVRAALAASRMDFGPLRMKWIQEIKP